MLACILPAAIVAEEIVTVTTEEALILAVADGGSITLGADIGLNAPLQVSVDTALNLQGYSLKVDCPADGFAADIEAIFVVEGAHLTVRPDANPYGWNGVQYEGAGSAY